MRVLVFVTDLGMGGSNRAACCWARDLKKRGHHVEALVMIDGSHRADLERHGVPLRVAGTAPQAIAEALREMSPEAIHVHTPGYPGAADALGTALQLLPRKIPVVQTNIFGLLQNPEEDAWTDFRLFISWTNCVQAARRAFQRVESNFFRRASVAVYPVDPVEASPPVEVRAFRERLGVAEDEVLFGRFSRPEPNKWTNLALDAFRAARRSRQKIKLLLREPPPRVAADLRAAADASSFVILPATSDDGELRLTMSALDAVLHTSSIGESFGYGIAEPMNLGKPVVTHSVPWGDQAQIELVRHGECGFVASTVSAMAGAIRMLADDAALRGRMGAAARQHIRRLADPGDSTGRLEAILRAAVEQRDNPFAAGDLTRARAAADYLDAQEFGHSLLEQITLRPLYWRARIRQWRNARRISARRLSGS